jgi:hypothetical protein
MYRIKNLLILVRKTYPDPSNHFNADPESSYHFNADPDPAPHQSDANLRPLVYIQNLKGSILSLHAPL